VIWSAATRRRFALVWRIAYQALRQRQEINCAILLLKTLSTLADELLHQLLYFLTLT
jgi:hypothetical protein